MRLEVSKLDFDNQHASPAKLDSGIIDIEYEKVDTGLSKVLLGKEWLEIELFDWPKDHETIEITSSIEENQGKVAILSPISDDFSKERFNVQRTLNYNPIEYEPNIYIECKSWDFGEKSTITIHRNPNFTENHSIKLLLLLRPAFTRQGEKCKIKFNVSDKSNPDSNLLDQASMNSISTLELNCCKEISKDKIQNMRKVHEILAGYNVYSYNGEGNSIHPKQNLTIRGLEHIIDQFLTKKKEISIGYIGTDTTENFCSIIRWLEKSKKVEKISRIDAWYTNEWDSEFIDWLSDEHPLVCHKKVKPQEISPATIQDSESCDIIISTYVSPWAGLNDELYKSLLKSLMSKDSYLLSVDPQSSAKSVRLPLIGNINNQTLYRDILEFIPAKMPITKENPTVEWSVWQRRKSTTGAN